jgi:hypothetical protein
MAWNAGRILLDTGLGERPCVELIEQVEVVALSEQPQNEGFVPLTGLGDYLERRESQRCLDM